MIVTDNPADFPPSALPAPLTRQSLDDFLLDELDLHPGRVVTAVRAIASRTRRSGPAMTAHDIAIYMHTQHPGLRRAPADGTRQSTHSLMTVLTQRQAKTSTAHAAVPLRAMRVSLVIRGSPNASASATYCASYALRL